MKTPRMIERAWVVRDAVPGPDVDEFADGDRVRAVLSEPGAEQTLLAVQHPHRMPDALANGLSLEAAIPDARRRLAGLLGSAYRDVGEVIAPYRVSGPEGTAVGVLCMVDPEAATAGEEVYPDVVAERAGVLRGLGVATSAAMLVPVGGADTLTAAIGRACTGPPAVSTVDHSGSVHELWLLGPGEAASAILAEAGAHPLLVADGNHRVAAAKEAGLSELFALVTAGPELRVGPIHRALVGVRRSSADLAAAWRAYGLAVTEDVEPEVPERPGSVTAVTGDGALSVRLPDPVPADPLPRIDHGVVEHLLVGQALGVDPDSPALRPFTVRPPERTTVRLLIAPVPFADVLAVHADGRQMPRKSTYFTPKPRSGLVLAGESDVPAG
jgi:hypothetical protein